MLAFGSAICHEQKFWRGTSDIFISVFQFSAFKLAVVGCSVVAEVAHLFSNPFFFLSRQSQILFPSLSVVSCGLVTELWQIECHQNVELWRLGLASNKFHA